MNKTALAFETSDAKLQNWMHFYNRWGGWDPTTSRFKKIGLQPGASDEVRYELAYVQHVLDSIAAAIEADKLNTEEFPASAFVSEQTFRAFVSHLEASCIEKWMNERHFYALSKIYPEEQVCTYLALADTLNDETVQN